MIPSTFTVFLAATLSINAAPIFPGFFAAPAAAPAVIQKRDLTGTEFAQGSNFFFKSLLLESECSPGQVACINNNTATCAPEGNWEITPCTGGSSCLAVPASSDPTDTDLVVKCMSSDTAFAALGTQDVAVDFQIDTAPMNTTVTELPSDSPSDSTDLPTSTSTDESGEEPTSTDSASPTCTPGDDDGDEDPTDGDEDPTDSESVPEFSQTLGGDVPTPTDDVPTPTTSSDDSTGTCTEDPAEPTETEYITVIAFPEENGSFSFSTIEPTPTDALSVSEALPSPTDSSSDSTEDPTDSIPSDEQPSSTDSSSDPLPTGTDADVTPTDSTPVECTATETDSYDEPTPTDSDSSSDPAPTDVPTDSSSSSSDETITRTTIFVSAPENAAPSPSSSAEVTADINPLGTHFTPASSSSSAPSSPTDNAPIPIKKRMVRRRV